VTIRSSRHPIGEHEFRIETGNHPGAPVEATTQARRVAGQCVAIRLTERALQGPDRAEHGGDRRDLKLPVLLSDGQEEATARQALPQ